MFSVTISVHITLYKLFSLSFVSTATTAHIKFRKEMSDDDDYDYHARFLELTGSSAGGE